MAPERGGSLWRAGVVLALLWLPGCVQGDDPIGGETHFLQKCGAAADVCGGFDCLGEVCTWYCSEDSQCAAAPAATCVFRRADVTGSVETSGRCDVPCANDDECRAVSSLHVCEAGSCRADTLLTTAPSSSATSSDPDSGQDLPSPTEPSSSCEAATEALDQRVVLGDSFFATSPSLANVLGDAALYRDYARLAFNALALGGRGLEDQYLLALAEGPVDTVIMTGGGADVLVGTCPELDASCPVIADAAGAARDLLERFSADGVQHVLYVSYPNPLVPEVRERMDVLRPLLDDACRASSVPCHFVDLRPVFEGHYDTYVQADGLNPTELGTRAIATTLWATMDTLCLVP